jgi:methionyl-tRNA formyltransferase
LAKLSADLLLETITAIETNEAHGIVQDDALSTHSSKINKEDAQINWNSSAQQLERIIRAYNPWPVAYTIIDGQTVRLWEAEVLTLTTSAAPGTIIAASKNGIDVATKDGILRLIKLQLPGKKVLTANEILNGHAQLFAIGKHITTIK